eukprot:460131_1
MKPYEQTQTVNTANKETTPDEQVININDEEQLPLNDADTKDSTDAVHTNNQQEITQGEQTITINDSEKLTLNDDTNTKDTTDAVHINNEEHSKSTKNTSERIENVMSPRVAKIKKAISPRDNNDSCVKIRNCIYFIIWGTQSCLQRTLRLLCFLIYISIDVWLFYNVATADQDALNDYCLNSVLTKTTSTCSNVPGGKGGSGNCNPREDERKYYPRSWMLAAGILDIIFVIILLVIMWKLNIRSLLYTLPACVFSIFQIALFIISCVGFTIHNIFGEHCQNTVIGISIVVWSLVRFFQSMSLCCWCLRCLAKDHD